MAKKITEIEAELQSWDFLQQLPKELEGFTLREGTGIKGNILNIASYVDESNHVCVDLIYTGETFDYVIVKNLGLHTFRDDRFFTRDKDKFAEVVLNKLPSLLQDMGKGKAKEMGYDAISSVAPFYYKFSFQEIKKYYFHGVSHSIGLDTHDPFLRNQPLPVNAVISNEPGLYIAEEGIGIRIEDDILVTEDGAINLSKDIIKTVDEIEEFIRKHKENK